MASNNVSNQALATTGSLLSIDVKIPRKKVFVKLLLWSTMDDIDVELELYGTVDGVMACNGGDGGFLDTLNWGSWNDAAAAPSEDNEVM